MQCLPSQAEVFSWVQVKGEISKLEYMKEF